MVERGLAAESSAKAPEKLQERRKFSSCKGLKIAGSMSALAYVRDCFPASQPRQSETPREGEKQVLTPILLPLLFPKNARISGNHFCTLQGCFLLYLPLYLPFNRDIIPLTAENQAKRHRRKGGNYVQLCNNGSGRDIRQVLRRGPKDPRLQGNCRFKQVF